MPDSQQSGFADSLPIVGAGLAAATTIGQAVSGAVNLRKDKRELSRLSNPFYKIQDEYFQNKNMSEQLASSGLTPAAKDYFTTQSERGLGSGLNALTTMGGSPNDVAHLFDAFSGSVRDNAAQDAEAQLNNIKYFMGANKDLAGQKTMQWTINDYQPHQAKLKELTERIAADKQNIFGGATGVAGAVGALGTTLQNDDLMKNLFPKPSSSSPLSGIPDPFSGPGSNSTGSNDAGGQGGKNSYSDGGDAGGDPAWMQQLKDYLNRPR